MMSLRENIAPALKAVGFNYKYDVSLPIQDMYSLVEKVCDACFSMCLDVRLSSMFVCSFSCN